MRRSRRLALVAVVTSALTLITACSGASDLSVEIVELADRATEQYTFVTSGEAVDDGVLCASGSWVWTGNRDTDGEPMPDAAIGAMFEEGEPFTLVVGHDYTCDDGSGSFVVDTYVELDPNVDPPQVGGTWEISGGTGGYASVAGSGDIADEDNPSLDVTTYVGTVSTS